MIIKEIIIAGFFKLDCFIFRVITAIVRTGGRNIITGDLYPIFFNKNSKRFQGISEVF